VVPTSSRIAFARQEDYLIVVSLEPGHLTTPLAPGTRQIRSIDKLKYKTCRFWVLLNQEQPGDAMHVSNRRECEY